MTFKWEKYRVKELRDVEVPLHQSSISLKEILDICENYNVKNFEDVRIQADEDFYYNDTYASITLILKNQVVEV